MKRGIAPAGVILMGIAVALAALGVGYGLWSDTLRISGAVATGSINAAFSLHEVDEGLARGAPDGPKDNGINEDMEAGGIDTAECYARVSNSPTPVVDAPVSDSAADDIASRPSDFLFVYLKNAYPSFNCYVDFDVHNIGSIPLKVNQPVIGPQPGPGILTVELQNCYANGTQLEPGKEALCTLHVHVERGARPDQLYRFGATICTYQWNVGTAVRCATPADLEPIPADVTDVAPAPRAPSRP
jgi:hypothetical protein